MMHGHKSLKFANAKQAQEIFKFKTLKRRLHITTAAIWFNKACRTKQLTPTHISIKINDNSRRDKNTIRTATHFRLTQEIKFLHTKRVKLNERLYKQHLECAALSCILLVSLSSPYTSIGFGAVHSVSTVVVLLPEQSLFQIVAI